MATRTDPTAEPRVPLSRERVLAAAVTLADTGGMEALTMRNLAGELGVEAMSLYYHVANKEAILDGVVDAVVGEIVESVQSIDMPSVADDWRRVLRTRILAAREVLLRHPWAPGVIETRTRISPATMHYFEATVGVLRAGGFSHDLTHHAMHALGSRALGFTQELFEPDQADEGDRAAAELMEQMADQIPHLVEMMLAISHDDPDSTLGWCDDQTEFEFGLDLILGGLDRLRLAADR